MGGLVEHAVELLDFGQVIKRAVASGDLVHGGSQHGGADPAGSAEATALMGEEVGEVARHLEHVAGAVEHHEGAGGGEVFEGDAAVELIGCDAHAGGAAYLYGESVFRATVGKHLAHSHPERIFVDTRASAVAGYRQHLGSSRLHRADAAIPVGSLGRHQGGGAKGLDVVQRGRALQVAVADRVRWPVARDAALAFERLDQRRFLTADIGTGTQVDFDVEVEAGMAQNVASQQASLAPPRQHAIERRQQIAVFAAQIEKALATVDGIGAHRHAFEHQIGLGRKQDAILEGAGLALVGVAHHITPRICVISGGVAAGRPFQAGGEAGATAPAQVGMLDFLQEGGAPQG